MSRALIHASALALFAAVAVVSGACSAADGKTPDAKAAPSRSRWRRSPPPNSRSRASFA